MFWVRCSSTAARSASDQGRFRTPRFPASAERIIEFILVLTTVEWPAVGDFSGCKKMLYCRYSCQKITLHLI